VVQAVWYVPAGVLCLSACSGQGDLLAYDALNQEEEKEKKGIA